VIIIVTLSTNSATIFIYTVQISDTKHGSEIKIKASSQHTSRSEDGNRSRLSSRIRNRWNPGYQIRAYY